MAGAVQFDWAQFQALFPQLVGTGGVTDPIAEMFFGVAEQLFDNTAASLMPDPTKRLLCLNYATAHVASLSGYPLLAGASSPSGPSGAVGRVSSATEGTVSIQTDYGPMRENEAWWLQTQYGAFFWQLTRALRTARYVAAPPRYFGPAYGLGGYRGGWR